MRIYCLASISQILPSTDYVAPLPYDVGADELELWCEYARPMASFRDLPSDYRLTEICIGWALFRNSSKKLFEMQIYQKNSRLLKFEMLRGLATLTHIDKENFCFDLCLAVSQQCSFSMPQEFDLKIRAFCIRNSKLKNTTKRSTITPEEELAYDSYAQQINDFWNKNPQITADNLRLKILEKFGPINLPNQSIPKYLKQKLSDLQKIINLLCNPVNGNYKNVTPTVYNQKKQEWFPSRIYQQSDCFLYLKETIWNTNHPRNLLHEDKDKFRDCKMLRWKNVTLNNKIDFNAFNFQQLYNIYFEKVNLGPSLEFWHKLTANINFHSHASIILRNCGIKVLDDKFFDHLTKVKDLRLPNNDIISISKNISKLTNLSWLDFHNNKNLADDGIPWSCLPQTISSLDLENTNITTVPEEIKNLIYLQSLEVRSPKLKHISWSLFSDKSVEWCRYQNLHLCGGGAHLNEIKFKEIEVMKLVISDLKFTKIDSSGLHIPTFSLINNDLKTFNMADINYDSLYYLKISKNGLKNFSWKHIPKRLRKLDFSYNKLKDISVAEDEEIDFSAFVELRKISFKGNKIKSLPEGFQNLPLLQKLNLSGNNFGIHEFPVTEYLWKRIPKFDPINSRLKLNGNKIDSIPCCLKNGNIQQLKVSECHLHYICPYLHTNVQKLNSYMIIEAIGNPQLELSFIPNKIYQLPKPDVQPVTADQCNPAILFFA